MNIIRGSFHKQVTKQHNFGNFQSMKNPNIRVVRNFMLSTSCELYYDDVTVSSFIDIKCGNVAVQSIP